MMYPTSQYMDPFYSHYRNHAPHYYPPPPPGWEAGHPRAMESSYRPPSYGPWPYNAGMNHPHPPEFHCCCSHSYPPGYYSFRPSFPQELPPPHLYYHGPFPQHPNEYPSSYFVHPHPHPVEQKPYDYNMFKSHCCGCPNHVHHGGEKSNVKIEEERPDGMPESELKDADSSSVVRHPNNQYPVIWLPPGKIEDKENGKRYELPQQLLNGWVPVVGKRTEEAKQQGQDDQKDKQFQWPLVWMPAGYDEPKQKAKELKEKDGKSNSIEATPPSPKVKIIPLSWFEDQKPAAKSGSRDDSDRSVVESQSATNAHRDGTGVEGHSKTTPIIPKVVNDERKPARENYKTIPVLPDKETGDKKVGTCRTIPVLSQKEIDEKKHVVTEKEEKKANNLAKQGENGKGNHSESTKTKHSKLPPVCLRLDPLPRKKPGNGSSRSPSPPTRKDADIAKQDMNEVHSHNLEPKQSDSKNKHTVVSEMKEKSPEELKKEMGFSNETVTAASAKHSQEVDVLMSNDHQKVQASSTSVHAQENTAANVGEGGPKENAGAETLKGGGEEHTDRDSKAFRAKLSESDAAVRIQSAYRGYDTRRWQPLDKLRKIRGVHEQMQRVRNQLQSLEAPSKKCTEKEQVAIGEAIMNLLLNLDTIQGLHPCVREARKSVTRELIGLQEKLDSLCKQQSGGFNNINEDKRLDRAESVIHTAGPPEAYDKEEKAAGQNEGKVTSLVDPMELCDAIPSEVSKETGKDAYPSELENQKEQSCTSTLGVPHEEAKAAGQIGFQGASSADMIQGVALPKHSCDNHEGQIEESNAGSLETKEEKKVTVMDEGQEVPLVESMGSLHDAIPIVDSSEQEKCMASTGQIFHAEESNTDVSPAVSGDVKAATATESLDNGLAADDDGSIEDQNREAVGVRRPEFKHVDEIPDAILEDSHVSLKDGEPYAADSITFNVVEQPEVAMNMNMQELVANSTQDSTKEPAASEEPSLAALFEPTSESDSVPEQTVPEELNNAMQGELVANSTQDSTTEPDGTSEASTHDTEPAASEEPSLAALFEPTSESDSVPEQTVLEELNNAMQGEQTANSTQDSTTEPDETSEASTHDTEPAASEERSLAALFEPTSESDPVPEQTVLEELNNAMQGELSGKDDALHVDQNNELELSGGELNVDKSNQSLTEEADPRAELSCAHEDAVTGYERPEIKTLLEGQTAEQNEGAYSLCADAQAPRTKECTEKEAPAGLMGANSDEKVDTKEVGTLVSETEECNGMLNDCTVCAKGVTSLEVETDNQKEDVSVQTESKPSEEPLSTSGTLSAKDSDEKKLAEENQKLRALLQMLLASGNDQMEIITDLSEKVKVLERKLARKKKPKVMVLRPVRNATAKVH